MSQSILDLNQIRNQLHSFYSDIHIVETTGSTNDDLKEMASSSPIGTLLLAREQTSGKGQKGRSFTSNKDQGIYVSILLKPTFSIQQSSLIPFLSANALISSLLKTYDVVAKSKWVNDVFIDHQKVAGILCESSFSDQATMDWMVVGIGVNVYTQEFPEDIEALATSIEDHIQPVDINELLVSLLNEFARRVVDFDPMSIIDEYRANCMHLQKTIGIVSQGKRFIAECVDIDDEGCLVVTTDSHSQLHLSSVEVMLIKGDPS